MNKLTCDLTEKSKITAPFLFDVYTDKRVDSDAVWVGSFEPPNVYVTTPGKIAEVVGMMAKEICHSLKVTYFYIYYDIHPFQLRQMILFLS